MSLEDLKPGDNHYKAYVGPPLKYDIVGAMQFNLLTTFGLRDFHKLLDIGCGSLRSGKLLIPFLKKNNYFGVEPNNWLLEDGIKNELGNEIISIKSPKFIHSTNFDFKTFNEKFDFLIAQSIFSHASSDQIIKCLEEAKYVMKKESYFLATFVLGKENYVGKEWVYPDCVKYTHNYIMSLIQKQNLEAIRTNWPHPNGQTWYLIYLPENRWRANKLVSSIFNTFSIINFVKDQKLFNNKLTRFLYKPFRNIK